MKTTLKKILLITLLFSAAVPSTMQANLDLAALRSGAIEIVSFLRENPIVVGVGVVGIAVFVWKMLKEKAMTDGFFLAVKNNNIEKVKQALANGTNVDVQNKYGDTALIKATDMGHFEIVKLLLENNALVNKENNDDLTALMKAAIRGHSKIVKSLLTSGADVNHSDLLGYTALMGAASGGHSKVVELLLYTVNFFLFIL
ncbi:MAG TPA: ankyrin repeat domain-containing protein [Candidatus Dependentiae bacterium]|nr:ankyrin repeat domain-containing protein [Candidatus Dependentiae bacterium]